MTPIGQSGAGAGSIGGVFGAQAAALGHQPFLTFYDDASGERTELSYATFFNWTAKAANLLSEELDVGRGSVVALHVTGHWTGAVVAAAAWAVGAAVAFDGEPSEADAVVVSEADAQRAADHPGLVVVGAAMGGRLTRDAPGIGFGDEVLAFGDDYSDPAVGRDDRAIVDVAGAAGGPTHDEILAAVAGSLDSGDRLLATTPLRASTAGMLLVAPAVAGASVVWCPSATGDLADRSTTERVTVLLADDGSLTPAG